MECPGTVDATMNAGAMSGRISGVWPHTNSSLYVWGAFTNIGAIARRGIALLTADGSVDSSFAPAAFLPTNLTGFSQILAAAVQPDGRVLAAGAFPSSPSQYVWRMYPDGTLDTNFAPRPFFSLQSIAVQEDGRVLVAADRRVYRCGTDGMDDSSFSNLVANGLIRCLAMQTDGKVLAGGDFSLYGNQFRTRVARLNTDGSLDSTFGASVGPDGSVYTLTPRFDGRILIGGNFYYVENLDRRGIAELGPDGRLDYTFVPSALNGDVWSVASQQDGAVLVGGDFAMAGSSNRVRIARLLGNGARDETFHPGTGIAGQMPLSRVVSAVASLPNGQLIAAGSFTSVNGVSRTNLVRFEGGPFSAPIFAVQPTNRAVFADESVLINAAPLGLPEPILRWYFNGVELAAVSTTPLKLTNAQTDQSGDYFVTASNVLGVATSATARVIVTDVRPIVLQGPTNFVTDHNASAQLSVIATGKPPLAYQWWFEGAVLPGKTNSNLLIASAKTADQGTYIVTVTNVYGAVTSAPAGLTVISNAPGFLTHPMNVNVTVGQSAFFSVTVTGTPTPRLQWQFNGVNSPSEIYSSISRGNVQEFQAGAYHVIASNHVGMATSEVAVLTVDPFPFIEPQPVSQSVVEGRPAHFPVNAYGRTPLGIQWYRNGLALAGLTNASFYLVDAQISDAGNYQLVVSNNAGSITSVVASLMVESAPTNAGAVNIDFAANVDGDIEALAIQEDGRILVAGQLYIGDGFAPKFLVRLLADGTLDPSFDLEAGPNWRVRAIAVTRDSRILIGGDFTQVSGADRKWLARLNSDGSLDSTFVPGFLNGSCGFGPCDPNVRAIALEPGGTILVVGRSQLAVRLHQDGYLHQVDLVPYVHAGGGTYSPPHDFTSVLSLHDGYALLAVDRFLIWVSPMGFPVKTVIPSFFGPYALAQLASGELLVGGQFTSNSGLARFTREGMLDASFTPALANSGQISAVTVQPDGRILLGGSFTNVGTFMRRGLARLNVDGTVDESFDPGAGIALPYSENARVSGIVQQPDGQLFIAGDFNSVDGAAKTNLARILNNTERFPSIALAPTNQTVVAGREAYFFVGTPAMPVTYQWQRDGTNIPNATGALLRFLRAQPGDAGTYIVTLSNAFGSATSPPVSLTVLAEPQHDGAPDVTFNPAIGTDDKVRAMVRLPDGRILIGGYFNTVNGVSRSGIARLHADGSLDETFNPGPGIGNPAHHGVHAILPLSDGNVIIAGLFTNVNGVSRSSVARLHANGIVDLTFDPGIATQSRSIYALGLQRDGKVILGGDFSQLFRLNTNGTVDVSFAPPAPWPVYALAVRDDQRILAGGVGLRLYNPNGTEVFPFPAGSAQWNVSSLLLQPDQSAIVGTRDTGNLLLRVKADGSTDNGFQAFPPVGFGVIRALAADECGRIIAGGTFRTSFTSTFRVARLHPNGGLESFLDSGGFDGGLYALDASGGGNSLLVAGEFATVGVPARGIARLHMTTPAPSFSSISTNRIAELGSNVTLTVSLTNCPAPAMQWWLNGYPIQGAISPTLSFDARPSHNGSFYVIASNSAGIATSAVIHVTVPRTAITAGALDTEFLPPSLDAAVRTLAFASNGRLMAGGNFLFVNGAYWPGMVRLQPNGSLDSTLSQGFFSGGIAALAVQANHSILAGGNFGLRRLTPDGTLDATFQSGIADVAIIEADSEEHILCSNGAVVWKLSAAGTPDPFFAHQVFNVIPFKRLSDGRIVVGGFFDSANGLPRKNVARLLENGVVDAAFDTSAGPNGLVRCLAPQSDGRVIIAGDFSAVGDTARPGLARLHADGTLDTSFDPGTGPNTNVLAIAVQQDGKIYLAGAFTNFAGVPRNRIARLLPDGSLDSSFNPGTGANGQINALLIDPFGRIFIGGSFSRYNGHLRQGIARIHGDVFAVQPAFTGDAFAVRVMTAGGWTYHLDRSSTAQSGTWSEVASALGDGTPITLSDLNPIEGSFYRVRVD